MELELVFNELSWSRPAPSREAARACADAFVRAAAAATKRGIKRTIRSGVDFMNLELAPRYHWWDWRKDPAVERDLQSYFRLIVTKYPAVADEPVLEDDLLGYDHFLQGQQAIGLGVAHRMDSLALSMPSSDTWNTHLIRLEVRQLIEGEVESHLENVRHASRSQHVSDHHADWIKQRLASVVDSGQALWKRSAEFFPQLDFCDAVCDQMWRLPKAALAPIIRGLFQLDEYAREWSSGPFSPELIQCGVSPDSAPTIDQFAGERTFKCPDGRSFVFSWHAKVGSWRVYFDWKAGPGRLLIGYVGPHLRTVKSR